MQRKGCPPFQPSDPGAEKGLRRGEADPGGLGGNNDTGRIWPDTSPGADGDEPGFCRGMGRKVRVRIWMCGRRLRGCLGGRHAPGTTCVTGGCACLSGWERRTAIQMEERGPETAGSGQDAHGCLQETGLGVSALQTRALRLFLAADRSQKLQRLSSGRSCHRGSALALTS